MEDAPLLQLLQQKIQSQFSLDKLLFYSKIPLEKHTSLKNGKRAFINKSTGKAYVTHAKGVESATRDLVLKLRSQANSQGLFKPIDIDVWVLVLLWFPRSCYYTKNGPRSKLVPDLDNALQHPLDCLQKANIISNDSNVCSLDLSRRLPSEDESCTLEIFIMKHSEPEK